jgi:hypothetical protein
LHRGILYFTLVTEPYTSTVDNELTTTEVIAIDSASYSPKRFKLDGYWEVEAVKDGKLLLWSFDEPGSENYNGTHQAFPLSYFTN